MAKTTIELPDKYAPELNQYSDRLDELLLLGLSQVKIEEALLRYWRGLISFGRGAELAGLSQHRMMLQARARGIEPRWTEKMIEEEIGRAHV